MHGAGNDYIYIAAMTESPQNLGSLSEKISNRHYGVGSDGLVAILHSDSADFRMRMFNADGSEAQMCGNASRCIGKFVYERGLIDKTEITLETLSGIKTLKLTVNDGIVEKVSVDMGKPEFTASKIPVASTCGLPIVRETISVEGSDYDITAVSMGNPHGVIFCDSITDKMVLGDGPLLETAGIWPERANIEFAKIEGRDKITMRVWERGSGETMACGTGACATVVAGVVNGLCDRQVAVKLPGGTLDVEWRESDDHVWLSGGAEFIADGIFYYES